MYISRNIMYISRNNNIIRYRCTKHGKKQTVHQKDLLLGLQMYRTVVTYEIHQTVPCIHRGFAT